MPSARIFTSNFEHGLRFSELLRSQIADLEIEILSPDQQCSTPADFEIKLEPYTAQQVLLEVSTMAGEDPVQVFVAPGVLENIDVPRTVQQKPEGLDGEVNPAESVGAISSSSTTTKSARLTRIEEGVAWLSRVADGLQQLWWRHCLIAEIQAIQRQRIMARARAAGDAEERKAQATRREKQRQLREEREKQAFFEALLEHANTLHASKSIAAWSDRQQHAPLRVEDVGPGVRSRRALAATAAVILFFGIVGTLAYSNRRPAQPLPQSAVSRTENIEEQVPFGSATARTVKKSSDPNALPAEQEQNSEGVRHMGVRHLQNRDEMRLSDDVTVRYFNHASNTTLGRAPAPVHATIAPSRSPMPALARNNSKPGIKLITDTD